MSFWFWLLAAVCAAIMFLNYIFASLAVPGDSWAYCFFAWFSWYRRRYDGAWYYYDFDEFDGGHPSGHRHNRYWTQTPPTPIELHRVKRVEHYRDGIRLGDIP